MSSIYYMDLKDQYWSCWESILFIYPSSKDLRGFVLKDKTEIADVAIYTAKQGLWNDNFLTAELINLSIDLPAFDGFLRQIVLMLPWHPSSITASPHQ